MLIGPGSSAYWTFGVEHLVDAGALSSTASRMFLGVVGVASVLATVTADLAGRLGPRRVFVVMTSAEAAALALLALVPTSLAAALGSAILFGAAYNATLAVETLWSAHVFSGRPSLGLSAVLAANGAGFLLGPLGAGLLAGPFGLGPVLLAGAGIVAAAGLLAPREAILPRPDPEPGAEGRAVTPGSATPAGTAAARAGGPPGA